MRSKIQERCWNSLGTVFFAASLGAVFLPAAAWPESAESPSQATPNPPSAAAPSDVQERAVPRMGGITDLSGASKTAGIAPVASGGSPHAAPPPLGPPDPVAPVKEVPIHLLITNARDATGKNIGVRGQIDQVIANVNAMAAQQPSVRVKIKVESFTAFGPSKSATTFTDRPNHHFVRIPYMVGYKVYDVKKNVGGRWVPTTVTRNLSQSIGVHVFCDRWETGKGSLKLVTDIARPYMEPNQGIAEQVVDFFVNGHLTDFIDRLVHQQLASFPITNGTIRLPLDCTALGRDQGVAGDPKDDIISYSFTPPNPALPKLTSVLSQVSVKLLSLKRLTAHDLSGAVLYNSVEAPALEFYANFQHAYATLPSVQEGQTIPLNVQPLMLNKPGTTGSLVLIANIIQNLAVGTQPTDSAFLVFGRDTNFGNGTRTLRIKKGFTIPPNPPQQPKPSRVFLDAYELTLQINAGVGGLEASPGLTSTGAGGIRSGVVGGVLSRGIEGEPPENSSVEPQAKPGASGDTTPVPALPQEYAK